MEEKPDVTYSDVGGCKEQINKLREVVETPLLHVKSISLYYCSITPLSRKSDQHQFSPNYINKLSKEKLGRINKMTNKGEMLLSILQLYIKFSPVILQGNVSPLVWRICMWILGLKGLYGTVPRVINISFLLTE